MTRLKMLTTDDKLAEIRRLYFSTTKQTIQQDLARALDLLKSMHSEEERERATVYMEGMAQMRSDVGTPTEETQALTIAPARPCGGPPGVTVRERSDRWPGC
jgi:hypothetical protein